MARYVALLRGVNVGGNNKLPMKTLAGLFAEAGCEDVKTFIQSGNVVFTAEPKVAAGIGVVVSAEIARTVGLKIPVILRSAKELARVVASNPYLPHGVDEGELAVSFLAGKPDAAGVKSLEPDRSPPDEFIVRGQEVYLRFPQGMGKSKLTSAWFDSRLKTVGTVRNWRTTVKLLKLAGG